MKLRRPILTVLFALFTITSMAQFTQKELDIIHSRTKDTPFRVLKTTDEQDSLILRSKSEDIDQIADNTDLHMLIYRLAITMETERGVGIAAPQVGVLKNVFLFVRTDKPDYPLEVAINPRIVDHPESTVCFVGDGCLSVPETNGNTARYPWIEVEYTNMRGEKIRERLEGHSREDNFTGIVFQHEFDHLQGVLFTDKLCPEQEENE